MVVIILKNNEDEDLFKYQTLGNEYEGTFNDSFNYSKKEYKIYSHDKIFSFSIDQTGYSYKIDNGDSISMTQNMFVTYENDSNAVSFDLIITNGSDIEYTIQIIIVPKIEIKETFDGSAIINFDRIGFLTGSKKYKLVNNSTWYVKLFNDNYDEQLNLLYNFEYQSISEGSIWESNLINDGIYNDEMLINSSEIKIKFIFSCKIPDHEDISYNIQFNKSLKNIILKDINDTNLGFSFTPTIQNYTMAIPLLENITLMFETFDIQEKWDIKYGSYNAEINHSDDIDINIKNNTTIYIYHRGDDTGFDNYYTITIEKLYINDGLSIVNENTPTLNELSNNFITNETNYFISLFNVNSNNKIYNISFDYYTDKIQTYSNGSFQDLSNVYYFSYKKGIQQMKITPFKKYVVLFNSSPTIFYIFNDYHEYTFEMDHGLKDISIIERDNIINKDNELLDNFDENTYLYNIDIIESKLKINIDYDIQDVSYNLKYYYSNDKTDFKDQIQEDIVMSFDQIDININREYSYHKFFLKIENKTIGDLNYTIIANDINPINNIILKTKESILEGSFTTIDSFFRYDKFNYLIPYKKTDNFILELGLDFNLSKIYDVYKFKHGESRGNILFTFQEETDGNSGPQNKLIYDIKYDDCIELVNRFDSSSKYRLKFIQYPIDDIQLEGTDVLNINFSENNYDYNFIPVLNTIDDINIDITYNDTSDNGIIYFDISSNGVIAPFTDNLVSGKNKIMNASFNNNDKNMDIVLNNKIVNEYAIFNLDETNNTVESYKFNTDIVYNFKFYKDLIDNIDIFTNNNSINYIYDIDSTYYYFPILKNDTLSLNINSKYTHYNNTFQYKIYDENNNLSDLYTDISNNITNDITNMSSNKLILDIRNKMNNYIRFEYKIDKNPIENININTGSEDIAKNILNFDGSQYYNYYLGNINVNNNINFHVNIIESKNDISFNFSYSDTSLIMNGSIDASSNKIGNNISTIENNLHLKLTNNVNPDVSYNIDIDKIQYTKENNFISFTNNPVNISKLELNIYPYKEYILNSTNSKLAGYFIKRKTQTTGYFYVREDSIVFGESVILRPNSFWYIDISGSNRLILQYIGIKLETNGFESIIQDTRLNEFKIIAPYNYLDFYNHGALNYIQTENIISYSKIENRYAYYIKDSNKTMATTITTTHIFENMVYFSLYYHNSRTNEYRGYLHEYANEHFIANNDIIQPPPLIKEYKTISDLEQHIENNKDYWFCFYEPLIDHSGVEISFEIPKKHFFSDKGILNVSLYEEYLNKYDYSDDFEIYDQSGEKITKIIWEAGDIRRKYICFKIKILKILILKILKYL